MSEYTDLHNRIRALELAGSWRKVADPTTGWLSSKTSGWTADSFSGGLTVDFSAAVPAGTKAVRCVLLQGGTKSDVFWRAYNDANISNTPYASGEYQQWALDGAAYVGQRVIWLSADYKAQFSVANTDTDLSISYPVEYLI